MKRIPITEVPNEPFGPVIYAYTRAQALADGFQVEVTKTAAEAGIKFPVFLTRSVFAKFVAVPPGGDGPGRSREALGYYSEQVIMPSGRWLLPPRRSFADSTPHNYRLFKKASSLSSGR